MIGCERRGEVQVCGALGGVDGDVGVVVVVFWGATRWVRVDVELGLEAEKFAGDVSEGELEVGVGVGVQGVGGGQQAWRCRCRGRCRPVAAAAAVAGTVPVGPFPGGWWAPSRAGMFLLSKFLLLVLLVETGARVRDSEETGALRTSLGDRYNRCHSGWLEPASVWRSMVELCFLLLREISLTRSVGETSGCRDVLVKSGQHRRRFRPRSSRVVEHC
jgi:hypothetical protein